MTSRPLDAYLSRLARELAKRGLAGARIVEEARGHLLDAIDDGLGRGLSAAASERAAFARFGTPEEVAAQFARERHPMLNRLVSMVAAILCGFRGTPARAHEPAPVEYHDRATVPMGDHHFVARLKPPYRRRFKRMSADEREQFLARMKDVEARGMDVGALTLDAREQLAQFLGWFARRTLGPTSTLESLTLIGDTTDSGKRVRQYLASFSTGARFTWTLVHDSDGTITLDGARRRGEDDG